MVSAKVHPTKIFLNCMTLLNQVFYCLPKTPLDERKRLSELALECKNRGGFLDFYSEMVKFANAADDEYVSQLVRKFITNEEKEGVNNG